ncbi:hypothetical protein LINPERHAP2_LOCUS24586 [Linum perenne]
MQEDTENDPRCPKIAFSEQELRSFFQPWSKALVVKVLEKSFSFGAVKRRLESLWAKNGNIQVSDIANSFFLVRFENPEDYQRAAFGGPWKIYDYYFSVSRWTPDFNEDEPLKTILTWVRLPKLPIHFFNKLVVSRIGDCIGRTVRLDLATAEGARARYARVCVEVDISKPLLGKYMIEDRTFLVEYESLQNICTSCGFYGHKVDGCIRFPVPRPAAVQNDTESDTVRPAEEAVGEWMVVSRRSKGRSVKPAMNKQAVVSTSSKFETLADSDEDVDEVIVADDIPATPPGKGTDAVAASLAASLAAALNQASKIHDGEVTGQLASPVARESRPPLAEVTNVGKICPGAKGKGSLPKTSKSAVPQATLVDIPVVYDNPTFKGSKDVGFTPKVRKQVTRKEKVVSRKENSDIPAKPTRKDGKQIRSFVPQKGGPKLGDPSKEASGKKGDPPDRS